MKSRKYKEQFRLKTRLDARTGREKREAEYTGAWYAFPADGADARRRAAGPGGALAVFWLSLLTYLKTASATSRCFYALMPMLISLIPAAYGVMGLVSALRAPDRMTVVQRENGFGRLLRSAVGALVCAAIGAVGACVCLFIEGKWRTSWHEPLLCAAAALSALIAFRAARRHYGELGEVE